MERYRNQTDLCAYLINAGHVFAWKAKMEGLAPEEEGLDYLKRASSLLGSVKEAPRRRKLEEEIKEALSDVPKGS